ncbi:DUF1150 family protein [Falsiruegeria mediterranea]|jgi:hypothetical protein|uniref:DUF1150 domain-containing protein n=1 Tax=Falsiruegeria mediterranea M17 TaxID=1200281 RepID=A0A2R8C7H1_9RHOB|nr:DUF1150 family protein [Falsiruegeria mediterranea]SPJ28352.1 hypothetical protein TRM7615_01851 [Falsiruegeria mediterranea M17]
METPYDFNENGSRIVYVKTVEVADLPDQIRAEAGDHEQLYAVHDEEGQQLALVADRKLAFMLAREHDFAPVAVH